MKFILMKFIKKFNKKLKKWHHIWMVPTPLKLPIVSSRQQEIVFLPPSLSSCIHVFASRDDKKRRHGNLIKFVTQFDVISTKPFSGDLFNLSLTNWSNLIFTLAWIWNFYFQILFIDRDNNYVDFTETFEALAMAIMSTLSAKEKG